MSVVLGDRTHTRGPKAHGTLITCKTCGNQRYVRPSFALLDARYCSRKCAYADPELRQSFGSRGMEAGQVRNPKIAAIIESNKANRTLELPHTKLMAIEEHIVAPIPEDSFKPLLAYRGYYPLGRARSLLNYFTSAMELEIPTVQRMSYLTSDHGWTSKLAHLNGLHAYCTMANLFDAFGTRLLTTPEFTKQIPHLLEYVQFLRDEGGLKERVLRAFIIHAAAASPIPIIASWPFMPGEQRLLSQDLDGMDMVTAIDALVPKSLPKETRDDVCQDLVVAVLTGEVTLANLPDVMPKLLKGFFKMFPGKYGPRSLDAPLGNDDGGWNLGQLIAGTSRIEDDLCWGCEMNSDLVSDGLCQACLTEVMNRAETVKQTNDYYVVHPPARGLHKTVVDDAVAAMLDDDGRRPMESLHGHTKYTRPMNNARKFANNTPQAEDMDDSLSAGGAFRRDSDQPIPTQKKEYTYGAKSHGKTNTNIRARFAREDRYQRLPNP